MLLDEYSKKYTISDLFIQGLVWDSHRNSDIRIKSVVKEHSDGSCAISHYSVVQGSLV